MAPKRHYDIGYGKPPKQAQWKKGQSGNPKGRPRRDRNISALVAALLGQRIVVRTGKTTKRRTRLEHLVHRLFERALSGDPRLMKMALDEARNDEARAVKHGPETEPADREVLEALYRRLAQDVGGRAAAE
jgi:hypothetical protein